MFKVGYHRDRVKAFLEGKQVFPVTLELDLTSECTRSCRGCPSATAKRRDYLSPKFLDRLLGALGGRTTGLLLTGGEPTMAPLFPRTLESARQKGFSEIAVVTNGSLLGEPQVAEALLKHVTTIRVSLYDWEKSACEGQGIASTLRRIESLRELADREGSRLRIGVSALTSGERAGRLGRLADSVRSAGAHWLYFHPLCRKWGLGSPEPDGQEGVLARVEEIREGQAGGFGVFVFRARYERSPLEFDGYHAAHFLLVVGVDGRNYLGPEVKYQASHILADLGEMEDDGFLWKRERLDRIAAVRSSTYPALRSRHRGVLYNHFIALLFRGDKSAAADLDTASSSGFLFPHIL